MLLYSFNATLFKPIFDLLPQYDLISLLVTSCQLFLTSDPVRSVQLALEFLF